MYRLLVGTGMLAAIWGAVEATAQEERRLQREAGLFERLDANKDGVITSDEVPEERQKRYFERLLRTGDKDKDGKLTRDEFSAAGEEPQRPAANQPGAPRPQGGAPGNIDPERAFGFMDRNGDGKVTPEEVPEERREMFRTNLARTDKNGDGALNLEEFKASFEAMGRLMGRPGEGGPPNLANSPFFRALDVNRDGKISADELAKAADALKTLDRNGDGVLTPEELAPPGGPAGLPGRPGIAPANPPQDAAARAFAERLKQADANGDGKISRDEAPERLKEHFDRIDANSDGFIDQQELTRGSGRFQQNRPQQGDPQRRRPQQDNLEKEDNT